MRRVFCNLLRKNKNTCQKLIAKTCSPRISLKILAGCPLTIEFGGISLATKLAAPTIKLLSILSPGKIISLRQSTGDLRSQFSSLHIMLVYKLNILKL